MNVGDGRYGYPTRPGAEGVTQTEAVIDGKPLIKSSRKSAVGHRKRGNRLASRAASRRHDGLADFERVVPMLIEEVRRVAGAPRFRARKGQSPSQSQSRSR